jgi:hypothetical protein
MADLDIASQAQLRGDLSQFAERTRGTLLTLDVLSIGKSKSANSGPRKQVFIPQSSTICCSSCTVALVDSGTTIAQHFAAAKKSARKSTELWKRMP